MRFFVLVCLCAINLWAVNALDCSMELKDHDYVDTKIRHNIFCPNYDEEISPGNKPLKVDFSFKLVSFNFYEEQAQLTTESYISQFWADERLKWNPSDYNGVDRTYASVDELWIPDMTIYNAEGKNDMKSCLDTDCWVYFNGSIECTNPCTHTAFCEEIDMSNWPFDSHQCSHTYIARTRTSAELIFDSDEVEMSDGYEVQSDYWNMDFVRSEIGETLYEDFRNASHSFVKINFVVRRLSEAFIYQVIIPAAIMISMNVLFLCLNPMLSERIVLVFINFFCHQIYLEQLHYMLPKNGSKPPKALIFFLDSRYITVLLLVETVLMKMFLQNQDSVSNWVKMIVGSKTLTDLSIEDAAGIKKDDDDGKSIRSAFRFTFEVFLAGIFIILYAVMFVKLIPL